MAVPAAFAPLVYGERPADRAWAARRQQWVLSAWRSSDRRCTAPPLFCGRTVSWLLEQQAAGGDALTGSIRRQQAAALCIASVVQRTTPPSLPAPDLWVPPLCPVLLQACSTLPAQPVSSSPTSRVRAGRQQAGPRIACCLCGAAACARSTHLPTRGVLCFPPSPLPRPSAVFSIFQFHFTYALTLIHTLTTVVGMQGFLRVRRGGEGQQGKRGSRGMARRVALPLLARPLLDHALGLPQGSSWLADSRQWSASLHARSARRTTATHVHIPFPPPFRCACLR